MRTCKRCLVEKPESDFYSYEWQPVFLRCKKCCYAIQRVRLDAKRRPHKPLADRFWEKVDRSGPCWVFTGAKDPKGYGRFSIKNKAKLATHVAWELTHGSVAGFYVCHHCDNPPCVRPDHLFLGTAADNMADMAAKGRTGRRRLSQDDVRAIGILAILGAKCAQIAKSYGVSASAISNRFGGRVR